MRNFGKSRSAYARFLASQYTNKRAQDKFESRNAQGSDGASNKPYRKPTDRAQNKPIHGNSNNGQMRNLTLNDNGDRQTTAGNYKSYANIVKRPIRVAEKVRGVFSSFFTHI